MPKPKPTLSPADPPPLHLYRVRSVYQSTHEGEPQYFTARCREAVAELWFDLNVRDMEDPCELLIDQIRTFDEAHPA